MRQIISDIFNLQRISAVRADNDIVSWEEEGHLYLAFGVFSVIVDMEEDYLSPALYP